MKLYSIVLLGLLGCSARVESTPEAPYAEPDGGATEYPTEVACESFNPCEVATVTSATTCALAPAPDGSTCFPAVDGDGGGACSAGLCHAPPLYPCGVAPVGQCACPLDCPFVPGCPSRVCDFPDTPQSVCKTDC
jgi:hypothetical protein